MNKEQELLVILKDATNEIAQLIASALSVMDMQDDETLERDNFYFHKGYSAAIKDVSDIIFAKVTEIREILSGDE